MMSDNQDTTEAAAPSAYTVHHRFSIIWIIPLIALLAAGWLGWRSLSERGPLITITFQTAEGLEAGKTKIQHNATTLGLVESVEPSSDLKHAVVKARMTRIAEPYLTQGSRFWVVRPRLSAEGVSGLATLISGAYIEFEPGDGGDKQKKFTGDEIPPVIPMDAPGHTYTLHAKELGSINQGAPVYFQGIHVGEVLGYKLSDIDGTATLQLFVHAPHDQLVRTGTRFWNASGLTLETGGNGLKLETASLQTLLSGGIAFSVPPNATPGDVAADGANFTLYPSASAAQDAVFERKVKFLLHFDSPVQGLEVGSPVRMQGMRIGQVTDMSIEFDRATGQIAVPIVIDLEIDRVKLKNDSENDNDSPAIEEKVYQGMGNLVASGLRARLGSGNLFTGQKIINLDFVPDAQPAKLITGGNYPEIPTVAPEDLESVIHSAKVLLDNLQVTASTLNKAATSPEMAQSLQALNHALVNLDHITKDTSTQIGPLLQSLHSVANSTDTVVQQVGTSFGDGNDGGDLSGTLHELKNAARSIRELSDYLESHPEALIQGKAGKATP